MFRRCYICLLFLMFKYTTGSLNTQDYNWRDYYGIIPFDALNSGLDRSGRPIYIGQALHGNKLIPGKIYEKDPKIYFELNGAEHSTVNNVKILCSRQPQKFEWINTTSDKTLELTKAKIVINGGYEPKRLTFLGRVLTNGQTLPGKVICKTKECHGLYTSNGNSKLHKVYQILTYNPNAQHIDVNCKPEIDIRSLNLE